VPTQNFPLLKNVFVGTRFGDIEKQWRGGIIRRVETKFAYRCLLVRQLLKMHQSALIIESNTVSSRKQKST